MRESPAGAGAACAAKWFLPGGFSRKAGPIKHQLVLVCRSGGSARKNSRGTEGNDLYRPVRDCSGGLLLMLVNDKCVNEYLKRDITLKQNAFTTILEAEDYC